MPATDMQFPIEASDRVAVTDGRQAYTFNALHNMAAILAARIRDCGLRPGQRIGVLLPNSAAAVAAFLAVARSGHCYLPLNMALTATELEQVIERCSLGAVIRSDASPARLPAGTAVITTEITAVDAGVALPPLPLDEQPEIWQHVPHRPSTHQRPLKERGGCR